MREKCGPYTERIVPYQKNKSELKCRARLRACASVNLSCRLTMRRGKATADSMSDKCANLRSLPHLDLDLDLVLDVDLDDHARPELSLGCSLGWTRTNASKSKSKSKSRSTRRQCFKLALLAVVAAGHLWFQNTNYFESASISGFVVGCSV